MGPVESCKVTFSGKVLVDPVRLFTVPSSLRKASPVLNRDFPGSGCAPVNWALDLLLDTVKAPGVTIAGNRSDAHMLYATYMVPHLVIDRLLFCSSHVNSIKTDLL